MLETLHIAARSFNAGMNVWLIEPQRWSVLLGGDRINIWAVILGECVKSRKAFISFVMSVRLSVGSEQLGYHWTDFNETDI